MKLFLNEINYKSMQSTESEIKFAIAEAKVAGSDACVSLLKNEECAELFVKCIKRVLSVLKKRGIIELFVTSEELKDKSKLETAYLINKLPAIEEQLPSAEYFVIIKF